MKARQSPLGILGKYYACRHTTGQYRSFAVSGSYVVKPGSSHAPGERLNLLLPWALRKTIQCHPTLSYGLTDKNLNDEAHLTRIPSIQLADVLEYFSHESVGEHSDSDASLVKMLEAAHNHQFTHQDERPAWKVYVIDDDKTSLEASRIDIAFVCHHGIGDGISGTAFHRSLLENLELAASQTSLDAQWPYQVPDDTPLPIFVEDAFPLPSEKEATILTPQVSVPPFSNRASSPTRQPSPQPPYTFSPPLPHPSATQIRILTLPSPIVPQLITHCRSHSLTITALLHSLITIYLSRTIPSANTFRCGTPYSMRHFTRVPNTEIVSHISYISTTWNPEIVTLARSSMDNSPEEGEVIAKIAEQYKSEIKSELSAVPVSGPTALVAISKIKNVQAYCKELKASGKRGYTYELSNVGSVEVNMQKDGQVELEQLVFTQCGMSVGPAFGCSVVTVKGGRLCLSLHWEKGVVEESFMEGLVEFLRERMCGFGGAEG